MKCVVLCAFLACLLCESYARIGPTGPYYPYDLRSILVCQRNFEPDTVAPIQRIHLAPGPDDQVWLPVSFKDDPSLTFSLPRGRKDANFLNDLLGPMSPLTSPTLPTNMVLTRDQFEAIAMRSFPVRNVSRTDFVFPQRPSQGFYELVPVTNFLGIISMEPQGAEIQSAADAIIGSFANAGLGTAGCTANMEFRWTRLPDMYYPNYFLSGACPDTERCSLPVETGHKCSPNTNPEALLHVPVLRWECCFKNVDGWMLRECGWNRVLIPIVAFCQCRCA